MSRPLDALRAELRRIENEAIDAEVAASRDDEELNAEALAIVAEGEIAGWEALLIAEAEWDDPRPANHLRPRLT